MSRIHNLLTCTPFNEKNTSMICLKGCKNKLDDLQIKLAQAVLGSSRYQDALDSHVETSKRDRKDINKLKDAIDEASKKLREVISENNKIKNKLENKTIEALRYGEECERLTRECDQLRDCLKNKNLMGCKKERND